MTEGDLIFLGTNSGASAHDVSEKGGGEYGEVIADVADL